MNHHILKTIRKFLPFEKITYKTDLTESAISIRLDEMIEEEKMFTWKIFSIGTTKTYAGQRIGRNFIMRRIILGRNSFLPRIYGTIQPMYGEGYTLIHIKMRLHPLPLVFMIVWLSIVGFAALAFTATSIINLEFNPGVLIPYGMFLFGYLITIVGFKFESSRSKRELKEIFEAEILE